MPTAAANVSMPVAATNALAPSGRGEGLADLRVVDVLLVDVGAASEVVRLALHQGAGGRARRTSTTARVARDDLLVGGVLLRLAQIDVDELEARIDAGFGRLDAGAVVEVDVHLDAEFGPVVVDHVAQVGQTDRLDLAVADLDENR